ncbi:hypothetical protein L9F63_005193 [Diploptera punctata]|uniref:STAS domain-containing protein n=1 Tax=Diploptera punctata TaxID=6984 RepID=A0AAD8E6H1_DIPPU|nr:hypothetical protein L9F63_005193 [Diploptera punctata]
MSVSTQADHVKVQFSDIESINVYSEEDQASTVSEKYNRFCLCCQRKLFICLTTSFPFLTWILDYEWKTHLLNDFVAGLMVAVMHIPHGLAYSTLGNVSPIHGIYMAIFPVFIYAIFSTSRHVSTGTFAVICLMTGEVVNDNLKIQSNRTNTSTEYSAIEIGAMVSFTVGIWHLLLFCLRFGIVCSVLSGTFISSFTCGASIHVFTSQIKELLGIVVSPHYGIFGLCYQYKDIYLNIHKINLKTFGMSSVTILFLSLLKYTIVPIVQKKIKVRIPFELITILIANVLSITLHLQHHGINIVGKIPSGFPAFTSPAFPLFLKIIYDSFFITLVSYSVSMSMATMFATALNYDIDGNQELLAYGLANVFGSFLQCLPISSSLSRSIIQQITGGKSQIASLISCTLLTIVLLWTGPFFETLPRCVLAAVVIVSLMKMYMQVTDILKIWKLSKLEAGVWLGTFLSVVILDVKFGLIIGLILTLIHVFIQNMKPDVKLLGIIEIPARMRNDTSDEFAVVSIDEKYATEITGIKIIRLSEGLIFATMEHIKNEIYTLSGVNPQEILKTKRRMKRWKTPPEEVEEIEETLTTTNFKLESSITSKGFGFVIKKDKLKNLIIDMKSIKHIDRNGLNLIKTLIKYYNEINIAVYIISNYKQFIYNESVDEVIKNLKNQYKYR